MYIYIKQNAVRNGTKRTSTFFSTYLSTTHTHIHAYTHTHTYYTLRYIKTIIVK